MKKVNVEEKIKSLNDFILKNKGKVYTGSNELVNELHQIGLNKNVAYKLISSFEKEKMGQTYLYQIPNEPIYIKRLEGIYKSVSKEAYNRKSSKVTEVKVIDAEKAALTLLESRGYQIRKCVGVDVEKLKTKYPEVYKACLKYEIV